MIGTIEYREGNKSFPGERWCIVRTNGEVYPLHKDFISVQRKTFESTVESDNVEFVLKSDRYGIGPYGYVTKELSKEDFREQVLNNVLYNIL
jgi:hypothetical protein